MRFLETLTVVVVASLAMTACAEEGRAIAQDLTELRQQLGSQFQASEQDFQQAVQEVAKGEQAKEARSHDNWEVPQVPQGTTWGAPPRGFRAVNPYRPHEAPPHWPDARRHHHRHRPQPTPASRLRETAFQLDRLAHELEMAELYEGADTLRFAAGKLRKSARQITPPRQDSEAIDRPGVSAGKKRPK